MNTTMIRGGIAAGLALAATMGLGSPVQAQTQGENWYAYLGCWEPASGAGPTVCIRPTLEGVELARIADGQVVSRDALSTGDRPVRTEAEGCEGEHRASFSADGHRVFVTSDYVCEGGNTRHETAILALTAPDELLDVRSVDVDGEPVAWVQRYTAAPMSVGQEAGIADLPVPGMALETARRAVSVSIDTDDVVEAVDAAGAGAAEAWVAETGDRFELDAETLVALSDRGVPPEMLDLMIAISNPDRFALAVEDGAPSAERVQTAGGLAARGMSPWWGRGYGFASPFFYDPFFYDPFGYRYSRYSYGPFGWSGGWYGNYNPGIIVVRDGGGSASSGGRMVRGRGYTRGGSGGSASPPARAGTSTSVGRSGGSSSPPASSGGTVRRAKPRGGGGGGLF